MKKNWAWLLILVAVCLVLGACGTTPDTPTTAEPTTPTTPTPEASIVLDATLAELDVWETLQLQATTANTTEKVSWSSSDDSVATVSESGLVTAVSEGSVTITARVAGKEATCSVTVTNSHTAPVMRPARTEIALDKDATYDLTIDTLWKGNPLSGIEYTWTLCEGESADIAELTVTDSGATIRGLAYGETAYTVSAEVRGTMLSKKITIKVFNTNVSFVAENMTETDGVYRARVSLIATDNDSTTFTPQVKVLDSGAEVTDALVWTSSDPAVVSVENGVFKAQSEGTAILSISYMNNTFSVTVDAYRPEIRLNEKVEIETAALREIILTSALEGNITAVMMSDIDVLESINAETGALSLAQDQLPKSASEMGDTTIRIETDKASYIVSAAVYTKIIRTAEDLDNFGSYAKAAEEKANLWGGYFILGNDIEYNKAYTPFIDYGVMEGNIGRIWDGDFWNDGRANGFRGIFDGKGYTIKGLTSSGVAGGFVGILHENGIIRNVSFIGAKHVGWGGYLCSAGCGTVSNVYIQCDSMGIGSRPDKSGFIFSADCTAAARVYNCLVEVSGFPNNEFTFGFGSAHLGYGILNGAYVVGAPANKAINVLSDTGAGGDVYGGFTDYAALAAAGIDFSDWEGDFWTLVNGIPYPKHLTESGDGATIVRVTERTDVELNNSDITTVTVNLTSYGLTGGTLNGVTLNGAALANASFANGTLTLTTADFGVNWGEQTLVAVIQNGPRTYKVNIPVLLITKVIRTAEDLDNFGTLAKSVEEKPNLWGGYFVLGNNIDYNKTYTSFIDWNVMEGNNGKIWEGDYWCDGPKNGFRGVFDGNGYYIKGLQTIGAAGGFVGILNEKGIIRNVSFINAKHNGWGGYVCTAGNGTVSNVYIQCDAMGIGGTNDKSGFFFANDCKAGTKVNNCLVVITGFPVDNQYSFGIGSFHLGYGMLNGVYAVGVPSDRAIRVISDIGGSDQYGAFIDYDAFAAAGINFSAWEGDFWTLVNGLPYPKGLGIEVTKRTDVELNNPEIPTTDIDLTSYGITGGTLESLLFNGEALANASYADGILTLSAADFGTSWGNQMLEAVIKDGDNTYKVNIPVLLITKVIRTVDDLKNYYNLAKACRPEAYLWAGYFVLGNNIDCTGETLYNVTDWWTFENAGKGGSFTNGNEVGFMGVFDGRGYCISNATLHYPVGGLVGTTLHRDGVVRNLSVTNVIHDGGSGVICYAGNGRIENVYITIKSVTNTAGGNNDKTGGIISNDCMGAMRVVNCMVVYLEDSLPEDTAKTYALGSFHLGYGILKNVYAVGMPSDKAINVLSNTGTGGDVYGSYETAEAFAEAVAVSSENGWDMSFWTVDENGIATPRTLLAD